MLIDFLKTTRSKEELKIALDVLKEFKANENMEEYLNCPSIAWVKLEQLEEYLEHLANNKKLEESTIEFLKYLRENKKL